MTLFCGLSLVKVGAQLEITAQRQQMEVLFTLMWELNESLVVVMLRL